ncbi:DUF1589 domain-containing protein [Rhodopirellula baltica]
MANCRQSFRAQVGQVITWHPADALEQSEPSSNLTGNLTNRQPFTSPCQTWPTEI